MASLLFDSHDILMDATAVSNAFISEYLPSAPEGYAKVYLYGLMLVHHGYQSDDLIGELSAELEMKPTEITAALRYWERARLIERISDQPPVYKYKSVQQVFLQKQQLPTDDEYEHFSKSLYAIFGDKRKIHGNESSLAFEWVEKLGLEPEVVLMLIKHMMDTRGVRFSFKEAQKEALALKELAVTTAEEAEEYFIRKGEVYKGCAAVLRKLGMRRQPSEPEMELFKKWTVDWKISEEAVLRACDETVKGNPNFGYLDGIINNIHIHMGDEIVTSKAMEAVLKENRQENEQIRLLLSSMGLKRDIIDEGLRMVYRGLLPYGQDLVLLAAKRCGMRESTRTFDCLQELLDSWKQKGLVDADRVNQYLKEIDDIDKQLRQLSAKTGCTIGCSNSNRALLKKWLGEWRMPFEVIEQAALFSTDTKKRMPYMDKLLEAWMQKGIATSEAARQEHDNYRKEGYGVHGNQSRTAKQVIEQQYEQRPVAADIDELPPELIEEVAKL